MQPSKSVYRQDFLFPLITEAWREICCFSFQVSGFHFEVSVANVAKKHNSFPFALIASAKCPEPVEDSSNRLYWPFILILIKSCLMGLVANDLLHSWRASSAQCHWFNNQNAKKQFLFQILPPIFIINQRRRLQSNSNWDSRPFSSFIMGHQFSKFCYWGGSIIDKTKWTMQLSLFYQKSMSLEDNKNFSKGDRSRVRAKYFIYNDR